MKPVGISFDSRGIEGLKPAALKGAIARALKKAGANALRDMRSEASRRVRARKRIKGKAVREALVMRRPRMVVLDGSEWALDVRGKPVSLTDYPHRQTPRRFGPRQRQRAEGVYVEVNRGKRTLIRSAFVATMKSGHKGVFLRVGTARLPIKELLGSRPVDALLHEGEAAGVSERGARSFGSTFERVLPIELAKRQKGNES